MMAPQLSPQLMARIAYGRSIRAAADALLRAHGPRAEAQAWLETRAPDLSAVERAFREAVALRVSRVFAAFGPTVLH